MFKEKVDQGRFRDTDGRYLDGDVQLMAYLIWTNPESGFRVSDMPEVLNGLLEAHGRPGVTRSTAKAMARRLISINGVSKRMFGRGLYLNDDQIEARQIAVFQMGLRDTVFDKMPRIKARHDTNTPYHKLPQGGMHGVVLSHTQILSALKGNDVLSYVANYAPASEGAA